MFFHRYARTLVAVALLALSCGTAFGQPSSIRVTNMSSGSINVYIADSTLPPAFPDFQPNGSSNVVFGLLSQLPLRVTSVASGLVVFNGMVNTSVNEGLNVVLVDNGASAVDTLQLLSPGSNNTPSGQSQLRFVNTSSSALDFRITDENGQVVAVNSVGANAAADFSTVADGPAKIEVMSTTTAEVIYTAYDTLDNQGRQTIFATGAMADSLRLRALDELDFLAQSSLRILARVDSSGGGTDTTRIPRLRIVNLFNDPVGLDIALSGQANASLIFNEASEIMSIGDSASTDFNVGLSLIGGVGGSLFNGLFDLSNRDSITTMVAVRGGLGMAQMIQLRRERTPILNPDSGLIRVVNASTESNGAFDVRIISGGDTSIASALDFTAASSFRALHAGHFSIGVRQTGSAAFDDVFEGDLNAQSALTLMITGNMNDSTSFGISALNDLDIAAQRPLLRLRRALSPLDSNTARLRGVQLVADATARIDLRVGDSTVIRDLGYREASGVVNLSLDDMLGAVVGVAITGTNANVVEGVINFTPSTSDSVAFTTMFSIGSLQNLTARGVSLETRSSDVAQSGRSMLRVFNAVSASAGAPGGDGDYDLVFDFSDGTTLNVDNVGFGESTQYYSAASGAFTLRIMRDNDSTTMQTLQGSLAANGSFTLTLLGAPGSSGSVVRSLANSAAPVVDGLMLQDLNGAQPAGPQAPIPMIGTVASVGGVEIAAGLRVVPNPVNDVAYLRYGLGSQQTVTITLLDSKGAIAATFDVGAQAPGTYEVNLGVSGLPVGTYTAVLFDQRGDRLGSTRLVIAR